MTRTGGRVGEAAEIGPVVANKGPPGLLLNRRRVDRVLIGRRRRLWRTTTAGERHVELDHLRAADAAVASREEAVVAVVDHPGGAADRHDTRDTIIKAECAIVDGAANRVRLTLRERASGRPLDHEAVCSGARLREQFYEY